jgi:hypothetical protein
VRGIGWEKGETATVVKAETVGGKEGKAAVSKLWKKLD